MKLFSDFIGSGHLDWRKEVLDMNLKETTEILLLCSMVLINQLVSSFNQLIEDSFKINVCSNRLNLHNYQNSTYHILTF